MARAHMADPALPAALAPGCGRRRRGRTPRGGARASAGFLCFVTQPVRPLSLSGRPGRPGCPRHWNRHRDTKEQAGTWRDGFSGYSALHWAARRGRSPLQPLALPPLLVCSFICPSPLQSHWPPVSLCLRLSWRPMARSMGALSAATPPYTSRRLPDTMISTIACSPSVLPCESDGRCDSCAMKCGRLTCAGADPEILSNGGDTARGLARPGMLDVVSGQTIYLRCSFSPAPALSFSPHSLQPDWADTTHSDSASVAPPSPNTPRRDTIAAPLPRLGVSGARPCCHVTVVSSVSLSSTLPMPHCPMQRTMPVTRPGPSLSASPPATAVQWQGRDAS